ncbi:diguanylate cyclase [Thiohalocapsa sp. ML1]|uniref:GGDEF domain-containing protein n=1 Tax=Thiohalocapsa sp. ML1 TaxID=1431688 RepID=UPI000731FA94|nr:GGDEF domain-containing protein [Thiohalocapsa sp. ML1]
MYPFSVIDPKTLMLTAVGVFVVTGLFMALAHRIRHEHAYAWLALGNLAFAAGWALTLAEHVIGVNWITVPLSNLFLLLLPVMLICASLDFLRLPGIGFALIVTSPIVVTLFFVLAQTMHDPTIPGALTSSLNGAMYLGTAWIFSRYSYPRGSVVHAIIGANTIIGAVFIARTAVLLYASVAPSEVPHGFLEQLVYTALLVNLVCALAQALCFPLLDFMRAETDHSRVSRRLSNLGDRDSLTGTYNRRAFTVRLEVELQFHKPNRLPLSVILLDIDHLGAINDSYGRGAGDAALLAVAEIVESCSRSNDTFARYGDDEFALLLPETPQGQASAMAESIRAAVANLDRGEQPDIAAPMTCSAGVAALNHRGDTQATLMSQADVALFEAKRSGGNCVFPPPNVGMPGKSAPGGDADHGGADLSLVAAMLDPDDLRD